MNSFIAPDMFAPKDHRPWPFANLQPQAYSMICIDPPWHFNTYSNAGDEKSPQAQYNTMTMADIAALPVADLAAPDCMLWLWATSPMLDQQLQIMTGWGFRFATSGVWVKTTVNGHLAFGTGYILRSCSEPFLIGTIGKPKVEAKNIRSVIMAQVREHSRKPDEAYAAAEAMMPNARRADVFSRESRPGWEAFGDQAGSLDNGQSPLKSVRASVSVEPQPMLI